jgi:uncharacterized tellurite resistance protein B-like protein
MKFSDILSLFRQGKGTARSHMKNLIEMAVVDGNFDLIEYDLLKKIAKRNGIGEGYLKEIHENPGNIQFELPEDKREKFHQFYDLVHMMTVDNTVHLEEMKLCNLFAVKFGYSRERAQEIIASIQGNIKNNQNPDETLKRMEWLLD